LSFPWGVKQERSQDRQRESAALNAPNRAADPGITQHWAEVLGDSAQGILSLLSEISAFDIGLIVSPAMAVIQYRTMREPTRSQRRTPVREVVTMERFEKALVLLLRISAVVLLTAIVPAVMPFAWMKDIHRLLGMGELPEGPIVGYLTRSLSAMYALHGALVFFVSLDVRRHLPVIKCLAVLGIGFGAGLLVLDVAVGMPLPWIIGEGPFVILLGGVMLWLALKVQDGSTGGKAP
jgi:hypothetical protein